MLAYRVLIQVLVKLYSKQPSVKCRFHFPVTPKAVSTRKNTKKEVFKSKEEKTITLQIVLRFISMIMNTKN